MVKCLALLTASAGVWLAVAAVVVAAPSRPAPQVKHTVGFIESLALDGSVVAYDVQGDQPHGPVCNRVYAWNIATRSVAKVSGAGTCGADDSSTGAGVFELAVAGSRIAWIANTGGLSESNDRLFTATLPRPHERKLASTLRTGDVDCVLTGRTLGGLVGSGDLLAYNIWATAAASPGDEQSCATKITSGSLRRITAAGTSPLRAGMDTLVAQDADGGRVAVLHADGTVELFSAAGKPLNTIGVDSAKEIALAGSRLLVLTKTRRIQVYSTQTGRPGAAYPVPRVAGSLAAAGNIAAYASGTALHVIRLTTGKDSVVGTARKNIVAVAVSNRAIAYAYNVYERVHKPATYRDVGTVAVILVSQLG